MLDGKGTAFDLVVAIMVGSVLSRAITNTLGLLAVWLAGFVLIMLHRLMATLAYHLDWFGPLVKGHPVLLVEDGQAAGGADRGGVTDHAHGWGPGASTVAVGGGLDPAQHRGRGEEQREAGE